MLLGLSDGCKNRLWEGLVINYSAIVDQQLNSRMNDREKNLNLNQSIREKGNKTFEQLADNKQIYRSNENQS